MKQATDSCSVLMFLSYYYATMFNSVPVVNYQDIFSFSSVHSVSIQKHVGVFV